MTLLKTRFWIMILLMMLISITCSCSETNTANENTLLREIESLTPYDEINELLKNEQISSPLFELEAQSSNNVPNELFVSARSISLPYQLDLLYWRNQGWHNSYLETPVPANFDPDNFDYMGPFKMDVTSDGVVYVAYTVKTSIVELVIKRWINDEWQTIGIIPVDFEIDDWDFGISNDDKLYIVSSKDGSLELQELALTAATDEIDIRPNIMVQPDQEYFMGRKPQLHFGSGKQIYILSWSSETQFNVIQGDNQWRNLGEFTYNQKWSKWVHLNVNENDLYVSYPDLEYFTQRVIGQKWMPKESSWQRLPSFQLLADSHIHSYKSAINQDGELYLAYLLQRKPGAFVAKWNGQDWQMVKNSETNNFELFDSDDKQPSLINFYIDDSDQAYLLTSVRTGTDMQVKADRIIVLTWQEE